MAPDGTGPKPNGAPERTRASRVRTGCLTCRARKKKCDESKPTCSGCERNRTACRWPLHVLASTLPAVSVPGVQVAGPPGQGEKTAAPRHRLPPTQSVLAPSSSRSSMRQDHVACHNAHADENGHANLELPYVRNSCGHYETQMSSPTWMATGPTLFPDLTPKTRTSHLLRHYLQSTADILANGASPRNPFLVYMMPLTLSSDLIRHLVLTKSASHWARRVKGHSEEVSHEYYSRSIELYRHSIDNYLVGQGISPLLLAVGALTLGFIEVIRGDTTGAFYDHLLAAKPLLEKAFSNPIQPIPQDLRAFLTEYYTYTATLSMISTDARISNQLLLPEQVVCEAKRLVAAQYTGNLCGCWLDLLLLIPDIFNLGHRWFAARGERRPLEMGDLVLFAAFQQKILQWEPRITLDPDIAILGRIYQNAMLLYLCTAAGTASSCDCENTVAQCYQEMIAVTLNAAMALLRRLPLKARLNTNMCWPLAILGSCVTTAEDRQQIRARLLAMDQMLGFGNILSTLEVMEEMWKDTTGQIGPWNICIAMQKLEIWISFS